MCLLISKTRCCWSAGNSEEWHLKELTRLQFHTIAVTCRGWVDTVKGAKKTLLLTSSRLWFNRCSYLTLLQPRLWKHCRGNLKPGVGSMGYLRARGLSIAWNGYLPALSSSLQHAGNQISLAGQPERLVMSFYTVSHCLLVRKVNRLHVMLLADQQA